MQVTPAMIQRFLENKCTNEEAEGIQQYLLQHPGALDEWLPDEEWEAHISGLQLDKAHSNRLFAHIEAGSETQYGRLGAKPWLKVTAAAAVVAALLVALYPSNKPLVVQEPVAAVQPAPKSIHPEKIFRNDTRNKVSYTMDDGTIVTLYAHSQIVCSQPFDPIKRDIALQGKALFRVAKDKTRPFTVFTKGFSTTALGTTFRVTAYDSSHRSTVKLLEGEVVLRSLSTRAKPVYLKPGESCAFLQGSQTFRRIIPVTHATSKTTIPDPIDSSITASKAEIHFANTPLSAVLKKIAQAYKVQFDIENINLTGRKFTGSFTKQQSLDDVLGTIAGLNNITVTFDGAIYKLSEQ